MPNIALIAGSFHKELIEKMVAEASAAAVKANLVVSSVIWVPGSFEMPLALQQTLKRPDIAGVALLGIIERGETKHGMTMAQAVFPKVIDLQLEHEKPVGIGIIGPEVLEHQIDPRLLPHARAAVKAIATMLPLVEV